MTKDQMLDYLMRQYKYWHAADLGDGDVCDGMQMGATGVLANAIAFVSTDGKYGDPTTPQQMGKRGGRKGGLARAESLTPERRSEIAKDAANARWGNTHQTEDQNEPD